MRAQPDRGPLDFVVEPPESQCVAGKLAAPDLRAVVSQDSRVPRFEDDFNYHQRRGEPVGDRDAEPPPAK